MEFYVSSKAIEELNKQGYTDILDADGNDTGGCIRVVDETPLIYDLFGCGEHIHLDRVRLRGDVLQCEITTCDCHQYFNFKFLDEKDYVTDWCASE